jgi:dihydrofolate synthase/folylpolyglutamate synthase
MDNPHQQLKCVQIAGTKGKGSTCAMIATMLQECGYTVGLYTSPHLIDLRERVSIDGNMISYANVVNTFREIAEIEHRFSEPKLSFFEILTATAFKYFADQAVDIAIIETGLGGRLDCTNVITPLVCGITQISIDHTNILGKDLGSIAREKAGIFKQGIPAISIAQPPEVVEALNTVAEAAQTPLEYTGDQIEFSYRFEANRELGPHSRVCVTTPTSRFEHLPVPLKGEHQALNCGLALSIIDKLKSHEFSLPEVNIIEGLAKTELPGRMEQVHEQPRVVIDGAHNAASIQSLIRALGAHINYDSMVMIFGCGQDKDVDGMLKQLALGADKIIFTRAKSNPRAMEPEDLLTRFNELAGKMAQTAPNLEGALHVAGRAVSREDLVVISGSFYLVGESRKYFIDRAAKMQKR